MLAGRVEEGDAAPVAGAIGTAGDARRHQRLAIAIERSNGVERLHRLGV